MRIKTEVRLLVAILLVTAGVPSPADGQNRFAVLDSVIRSEVERGEIPGAAVSVSRASEVLFSRTYGTTAVDSNEPIGKTTLFRIGSITKTVTAVAVLSLVESGEADLHTPVREYMPGLPTRLGSLTLAQLLSHTSGVVEGPAGNRVSDPNALPRFCSSLSDDDRFHGIEGAWSYSNLGYALAGCAAAAAAGVTFRELIQTRVLEPLGMTDSTFDPLVAMARPLAIGHARGNRLDRFSAYANIEPAGSMFSSIKDMSRFASALAQGGRLGGQQVLPESVVRQLSEITVPATDIGWGPMDYGYGIFSFSWRGQEFLTHGGLTGGHGADMLVSPSHEVSVVVLANRGAAYLDGTKRAALDALLDLDRVSRAEPVAVSDDALEEWEGEYGLRRAVYTILERGGSLWLATRAGEVRLEAVSPDVLRIPDPTGHLPFPAGEQPRTNYYSLVAVRDDSQRIVGIQYALRVHPRWSPGS